MFDKEGAVFQCTSCVDDDTRPCLLFVGKDEGTPTVCPYKISSMSIKWTEMELTLNTK